MHSTDILNTYKQARTGYIVQFNEMNLQQLAKTISS